MDQMGSDGYVTTRVGDNIRRSIILGKHIENKQICYIYRDYDIVHRNENCLCGELVDDD